MNKKIIFVNATSATIGGSLTILNQFVEHICKLKDITKLYYIFVPIDCKLTSTEYFYIVPMKAKKYRDRIKWDLFGMKKWSQENSIFPDIIISLQNTAVRFKNAKQIIYLHQSIPYSKNADFSILKKDEIKLWFYKYIYKIWIDVSIKKDHYIVVQTNWMKQALIEDGYKEDKIVISKPNIKNIDIDKIDFCHNLQKGKKYLFYPAMYYKYKNHNVILKALIKIREENAELLKDIKVLFTLDKSVKLYQDVVDNNLQDNIIFLGRLEYEEVLKYYKSCDVLLFPSYIETLGLPLLEACAFNKYIIVSDCQYSREILNNYDLVEYVEYDNPVQWANSIIKCKKISEKNIGMNLNFNCWSNMFNLIDSI